jgi:SWI/SNF-related matrix-associated actin-dependent regulator of chromatin subfamily A3
LFLTIASIVFSSWKKTLDIVAGLCTEQDVRHVYINGKTPHKDRLEALKTFVSDAGVSTLLMTLGTGALG